MRRRKPELIALLAALGLHAATLGFTRSVEDHRVARRPHAPAPWVDAFEIELGDAPAVEQRAGVATASEPALDGRYARPAGVASLASRTNAPPLAATQETALENVEPDVAASEPSAPAVVAPKPIDLGLGPDGWQRWMTAPVAGEAPRAPSPPARNRYQVFRPTPASTTGGLQEGLDASDRARGLALGPEGRVLSALHKAAHAPVAPETGVARFEVTVHRTGAVEVTLGASTAHRDQWTQVAGHIASDLRSSPPRIPPPHEGFKYVVEVVAEQTLPNGTKAKSLKKPHANAPLKFQSTEASVEQTNRENPTLVNPTPDDIALKLDTPGVYVAATNKVCDYRAGLGIIAPGYGQGLAAGPTVQGACDPTNLGAKAQRVVRARVIAQSLF